MKKEVLIVDRDLFLQSLTTKKLRIEDKESDNIKYKANAQYRIINIADNISVIKTKINCGFEPKSFFEAEIEYNIRVEFEEEVGEEYIDENIKEILFPVLGECSYLLAIITKGMVNTPLILPTFISKYEKVECDF
ncbi:MAG: hypothetical protein E7I47_14820 [Clostridium sp.]|uniref:hypothetical protein n=1 Tax=Clostridium sp. TaxID=1506 RepID=UPI002907B23F|nr:hypothetical protein [Clostridium sp.]MDU4320570.1 hypothetical protein [Clostridium sp.]